MQACLFVGLLAAPGLSAKAAGCCFTLSAPYRVPIGVAGRIRDSSNNRSAEISIYLCYRLAYILHTSLDPELVFWPKQQRQWFTTIAAAYSIVFTVETTSPSFPSHHTAYRRGELCRVDRVQRLYEPGGWFLCSYQSPYQDQLALQA